MPETCHIGAAVNVRPPLVACFSAIALFTALSLVAAFSLYFLEKPGASMFLYAAMLLALLASVVGTTGEVSLGGIAEILRIIRKRR
jgi:hypothetical protein